MVVHGSYNHIYPILILDLHGSLKKASFLPQKVMLCWPGHCGFRFIRRFQEKIWLNPGVVGCPAMRVCPVCGT